MMVRNQLVLFILMLLGNLPPCLTDQSTFTYGAGDRKMAQPNMVFIFVDDWGWNDASFHGSNQFLTPNFDALAYSGVILNNYYVGHVCSPSRSALMTGKYPIHTGMQDNVILNLERRGLPLTEVLLPQYLNRLGYESHIVGKWHLGHYKKEYTPTFRGFKSHLGFWTGFQDYYDHTAEDQITLGLWGIDMRRGLEPAFDLFGHYSTDIFTDESIRIIQQHNNSRPLFLYIPFNAVHSSNSFFPLPAPDPTVAKFQYIDHYNRSRYAAVVSELDTGVGKIIEALKDAQMLDNTIIIVSTDNGGAPDGFDYNYASNWPLRGGKFTLFEGGVRGNGIIWSKRIKNLSRVSNQLIHITDWLPTLYSAAGGNSRDIKGIDGIDQWEVIQNGLPSKRTRVLHNIDKMLDYGALTNGKWKYISGSIYLLYKNQWDGRYGPSGREFNKEYNMSRILDSKAYKALSSVQTSRVTLNHMNKLRAQATVKCHLETPYEVASSNCNAMAAPCLFNIEDDPCETMNLADMYPDILQRLAQELQEYNKTALEPSNLPEDLSGNPKYFNNLWTNFGDYDYILTGNDAHPSST